VLDQDLRPWAGASSASSTPSASVSPSTSGPAAGTTVLVITLAGCEGCRVYARQYGTRAQPTANPDVASGIVASGRLTLTVPTARTAGMSFNVACRTFCHSGNALPVVVLGYPGHPAGSTVGGATAAAQREASGCWAGTATPSQQLVLRMSVFPDMITGQVSRSIRVWASPQLPVQAGTWEQTWHGGLGTQSETYCS
ncbi:MAG: hypothetical protein ACHQE5_06600, partial [Actinomycetes bacterium]